MKKAAYIICLVILINVIYSCNKEQPVNSSGSENIPSVSSTGNSSSDSKSNSTNSEAEDPNALLVYNKFSVKSYGLSLYKGNVVYNEQAMLIKEEDGSFKDITLMYDINEIVAVYDISFTIKYEEGKDYILKSGKISIPSGTTIPYFEKSFLFPLNPIEPDIGNTANAINGGFVWHNGGPEIARRLIQVTYRHNDNWKEYIPEYKGNFLPKTMKKLADNTDLRIAFIGDSISSGSDAGNASECPNYVRFAYDMLRDICGYKKVYHENFAEGGKTSTWGIEQMELRVNNYKPDLVVIAFGMNDGGSNPERFCENLGKMMHSALSVNPDCEFLLISTMLPNPDTTNYNSGKQYDLEPEMMKLEKEGVALVRVTTLHTDLLTRKKYQDLTGNHFNHPNDFLIRVYAQAVVSALVKDYNK